MSIFGSSYRTYVLNDFSAVSKAVFHVINRIDRSHVKSLPVQINPDKITGNVGESRMAFVKDWKNHEEHLKSYKKSETDNTYVIHLTYDIYDEYNVRTMNGLSSDGLLNDMSLFDTDTVTLEELKILSGDRNYLVLFLWGDIQIFGYIETVEFAYTAFSRWGNPLKAEATINMKKKHLGFTKDRILNGRTEIKPLEAMGSSLKGIVEGYQSAETAMITAAVAIDALR